MTEDEQIEEMAKDLCHTYTCEIRKSGIPCHHRCKAHIYATRAIAKGYRKASEVAREIFEEIEKSLCLHTFTTKSKEYADGASNTIEWVDSKIAELKKKYGGTTNDRE